MMESNQTDQKLAFEQQFDEDDEAKVNDSHADWLMMSVALFELKVTVLMMLLVEAGVVVVGWYPRDKTIRKTFDGRVHSERGKYLSGRHCHRSWRAWTACAAV